MTSLSSPFLPFTTPQTSGSSLKPSNPSISSISPCNLSSKSKRLPSIQARYNVSVSVSGERDLSSSAGIFIGGFVLGGIAVGTLGCIYAPQISKALAGADRKDLMRKLPKFIYDEEKALEKTRKILTEKIAQLNSAIDEVSTQLHPDDTPNGSTVNSDEIEAST
ncbi:uncharacterized protein LOC8281332 isoform X1 [Ricinus communis]|uniref:uncharacterized protein LOC8281332 isoform X1 n=1 Tax=Ricinus communis TaxID=3988 RepID=UPI00201A37D3|nr:uncharacterized protein LOC8281332 isoform X1 [Ricinus communis]